MKLRDFITIQGQLAQVLDIQHKSKTRYAEHYTEFDTIVKVKLVGDTLTHWINIKEIQELTNQKAAKVLFAKNSNK